MATPASIQQALGIVPLCGSINLIKNGLPKPLDEKFYTPTEGDRTLGDTGHYTIYKGTRRLARRSEYDAPYRRRNLKPIGSQNVNLISVREELQIKVSTMRLLHSPNSYEQDRGRAEVARQQRLFAQETLNLETACIHGALAKGLLYFDANGEFLPTSSGAVLTLDYQIQPYNRNQLLDIAGNTIIGASWNTASTDIPSHLRKIQDTSIQRNGYKVVKAYYGSNIPSYIAKNDFVAQFFRNNNMPNSVYTEQNRLKNLFGFEWIPAHEAMFEDSNGTIQVPWDPDQITFTPEVDEDWYGLMNGTTSVPTNLNIYSDIVAADNSFTDLKGMYTYAFPSMNPPGAADMHVGHVFLPIIKIPDVVMIADVTP